MNDKYIIKQGSYDLRVSDTGLIRQSFINGYSGRWQFRALVRLNSKGLSIERIAFADIESKWEYLQTSILDRKQAWHIADIDCNAHRVQGEKINHLWRVAA